MKNLKTLLLIVVLPIGAFSNAMKPHGTSMEDEMCGHNKGVEKTLCIGALSTTSYPTVILRDAEIVGNDPQVMTALLDKDQKIMKQFADHFEVEISEIERVISKIENLKVELTFEEFSKEVKSKITSGNM